MRTKLRSKVTLFFIVCAALLAFAGTALAITADPSGNTAPAPTIQSDKADYSSGELVTLTGSNWQPGESVNIVVNDDVGQSWNRNVNVTADGSGNISDSFNLPDWFVATYSVKATGASGAVATTSFTDATAPNAPAITNPADNSYDTDGNFTVSGTAEANSTVELFEGTTSKGTTQTDAQGNWSKQLTSVGEGSHTYTAKATDAAGNTSAASNSRTVIVDTIPPDAP